MTMERKIFRYRGDVQGVGFRVTAIQLSRGLEIAGFVKNEPDGDVTMDVQGPADSVKELARRVAETMKFRINETLIDCRQPMPDRTGFKIRY